MTSTTSEGGPATPRRGVLGGRRSGLLLHPTSLPGPHGIGDLGAGARAFLDFLSAAGQRLWQVLPLVPTGFGDSPYQGLGAFAGNALLLSPERLAADGLLTGAELAAVPCLPPGPVDHAAVLAWSGPLLRTVAERFGARAAPELRRALERWREESAAWIGDHALFRALKDAHGGRAWTAWAPPLAARDPEALAAARRRHREEIEAEIVAQFLFDRQWMALRREASARGVLLLGDLPIYPALDSAEVWAQRDLFQLDPSGAPLAVAGVPPDYFSATGQRWGNPLYRWDDRLAGCVDLFAARVRAALRWTDAIRLDHFRGLESYWAIPAGAPTAEAGAWRPGPGAALLEALARQLGPLPLVAENLGVITPEVEALRARFDLPGMAILQFAFGTDPRAPAFRPHAHVRDLVVYTGTHDNDTALGWWASDGGDSTRTPQQVRREKELARRYLATDGAEMNWVLLRAALASVADGAVAPLQDVLGLGSEARMNRPGVATGNWRWRFAPGDLRPALASRLGELAGLYDRA